MSQVGARRAEGAAGSAALQARERTSRGELTRVEMPHGKVEFGIGCPADH